MDFTATFEITGEFHASRGIMQCFVASEESTEILPGIYPTNEFCQKPIFYIKEMQQVIEEFQVPDGTVYCTLTCSAVSLRWIESSDASNILTVENIEFLQ